MRSRVKHKTCLTNQWEGRARALCREDRQPGNGGAASWGARRLEHGGAAEARQAREPSAVACETETRGCDWPVVAQGRGTEARGWAGAGLRREAGAGGGRVRWRRAGARDGGDSARLRQRG